MKANTYLPENEVEAEVETEEHLIVREGSETEPPIETPVRIAGERRLPEGTTRR